MSDDCCRGDDLSRWLAPELFKALSDPNRLAIVTRLAVESDAQNVSQVASCCDVDLSVVSRHLRTLRDAGVVRATRTGREVRYRVNTVELVSILRNLADALEACCPDPCNCTVGVPDDHDQATD